MIGRYDGFGLAALLIALIAVFLPLAGGTRHSVGSIGPGR